jgi:hypothetical protein
MGKWVKARKLLPEPGQEVMVISHNGERFYESCKRR